MNPDDLYLKRKLNYFKARFIFSRYRFHLRKLVAPFFLSFVLLDYWYSPENAFRWGLYRLSFFVIVMIIFYALVKYRKIRNNIEIVSVLITAFACNIVNLMIYESGGCHSKYFVGSILCAVAGTQLFKLNRIFGFTTLALSFSPLVIITLASAQETEMKNAIIQSFFLIGMIILSFIFGSSDDDNIAVSIKLKEKLKKELDRLHKTENLKKFFPIIIRNEIELDPDNVSKKRKMPDLVMGFADITNSTKISNLIDLEKDWQLKERFLESATSLALKNNLVVLTHLGDGFLFVANYVKGTDWQNNVLSFYTSLVREYEKIFSSVIGISGNVNSGVKFGLAKGDVIIGFLGTDQAYFTAIGPTVNLAARVCSQAESDEMVVTNELWQELSAFAGNLAHNEFQTNNLKGFDKKWNLVRLAKKKSASKQLGKQIICENCGSTKILSQIDGVLDYECQSCGKNEIKNAS